MSQITIQAIKEPKNETPVLCKCPVSSSRLRHLLENHNKRSMIWGWLKCELCLGYTIFEDLSDIWKYKNYRYTCKCGYRFSRESLTGYIPAGKILIWDEHEEMD